jgi:acyl-ACP thioesterase
VVNPQKYNYICDNSEIDKYIKYTITEIIKVSTTLLDTNTHINNNKYYSQIEEINTIVKEHSE